MATDFVALFHNNFNKLCIRIFLFPFTALWRSPACRYRFSCQNIFPIYSTKTYILYNVFLQYSLFKWVYKFKWSLISAQLSTYFAFFACFKYTISLFSKPCFITIWFNQDLIIRQHPWKLFTIIINYFWSLLQFFAQQHVYIYW